MTRIEAFRRHCAEMATADHKPECPSLGPPSRPIWEARWDDDHRIANAMIWRGFTPAPPHCDGCNPAEDRALFARLAAEVEAYQQGELFEETT